MTDTKTVPEETHLTVKQKEDLHENDYNDVPSPPDGGYGWVIVVASFMCNMVVDGIGYSFGIFLTEIADYYGEAKGKTAWVGSLLTGMCMCAGPLASALANKFGCRLVCIAGSLISAAAFVLSFYAPTVTWLMLIYGFIGGTGFGLIYLPAVVCVGYYFESKRSLATGIAVCGSGVGTFAFAPLATFLLEAYGWRGANLVLAVIIVCCAIFGALMRPLEYPTINDVESQGFPGKTPVANSKAGLGAHKSSSHGALANSVHDMRKRNDSTASYLSRNITEVENSAFASKLSLSSRKSHTIQPLARKDVFYSGSIANLKEFQSQKSLASYRQSILNIPHLNTAKREESDTSYMSLLKDPVFMLIAISNLFGMAAVYIPFVYLVDCAKADGIEAGQASFLLSIIGIMNTIGRIACGYFADFPQVNALLVNNICLVIAAISVGLTPFCFTYMAYTISSVIFAIALSGYISLTSIILVELLGLDKLTNAFGLLILFRGAAALVGSPLAGALYDATQSYAVPFYIAGILFGVSAVISFMVPFARRCVPQSLKTQSDAKVPINENRK